MESTLLSKLFIAAGLGLLVGLQREWVESRIAGIRTFPLIAILGVLSAALAEPFGGWVVAASIIALTGLLYIGNLAKIHAGRPDPGLTTEITALVMFGVGAALVIGYTTEAIVVGGGVAVLLFWKQPLHALVDRIGEGEFQAIIRLVLIGLVILPALPDRAYGPYEVLNPRQIWLMVVLIVGISLGAYIAYRMLGARGGTLVAGVMGGLISSTATTVTYSRRTVTVEGIARSAALVILIASTVVFARVLFEITLVAPDLLSVAGPPLILMMTFMGVLCAVAYVRSRHELIQPPEHEPPSERTAAIIFGLLYAAVILAVAAAKEHLGDRALYVVAGLSGLTDVDAITLSTAQLVNAGRLEADSAWRLVLVGAMANLAFKGVVAGSLGHRRLARRVAVLFSLSLAFGAVLLFTWPG
jgi:uncharacterized membrane protein (DUF4010 family)